MQQTQHTDVCILGGGMVGSAAAIGFAQQGYQVTLIEPHPPAQFDEQALPDIRVSALNRFTESLLQNYGVWPRILAMRTRQYDALSVWELPSHTTRFEATEIQQDYLGYFTENRLLQLASHQTIQQDYADKITLVYGMRAQDINITSGQVNLQPVAAPSIDANKAAHSTVSGDSHSAKDTETTSLLIHAQLIVGADGAQSQLRTAANIGTTGWQYQQQANVILIKGEAPYPSETWQQFTPEGPKALLPLHENYALLVWYGDKALSQAIKTSNPVQLKQAILESFPDKLGNFEVLQSGGFPLTRMHANQYARGRAVLLGDAAHTINPLAGQGVNLGYRDVAALMESTKQFSMQSDAPALLKDYEKRRRQQNLLMMTAMDVFYAGFSNTNPVLKLARNLVVKGANNAGLLKQKALRFAMGID